MGLSRKFRQMHETRRRKHIGVCPENLGFFWGGGGGLGGGWERGGGEVDGALGVA